MSHVCGGFPHPHQKNRMRHGPHVFFEAVSDFSFLKKSGDVSFIADREEDAHRVQLTAGSLVEAIL
jgi:hypothetical protein